MSPDRHEDIRMPCVCPACQKTLYSTAASRPQPSITRLAVLLFVSAGVLSAVVYFISMFVLRETITISETPIRDGWVMRTHLPTSLLALISAPIALVPGLLIGWFAGRMPKLRRLRCWNCGWTERYPTSAVWSTTTSSSPSSNESCATPFDSIVDEGDPWKDCAAWAYAEIRRGRLAEEVEQELIAEGWPRDEVETMVEKCRREARKRGMG
jgi:hypothetical protein